LFSDVSNSRELLDLMQSGKLEPEAAFINASLGAGRVPGPRGGAQGPAIQVEGVADHKDPALGARL
uniref:Uncharacterized protein n=1 Tax=Aegilops tauschii subsp. strangulata TaxID=200361 RepID=A0A453DW18_AEGTS